MKQPGIRKSRIEQLKYEIQQLDNKIYESNDKVLGNSLKKH